MQYLINDTKWRSETQYNYDVENLRWAEWGTEWTGKKVTINIEVKKGQDVWMRIDPLTADGIYCTMSNLDVTFETVE